MRYISGLFSILVLYSAIIIGSVPVHAEDSKNNVTSNVTSKPYDSLDHHVTALFPMARLAYAAAREHVPVELWKKGAEVQFRYVQIIQIAVQIGTRVAQIAVKFGQAIQKAARLITKAVQITLKAQKASLAGRKLVQKLVTKVATKVIEKGTDYAMAKAMANQAAAGITQSNAPLLAATPAAIPGQIEQVEKNRLKVIANREKMIAADAFRWRKRVATYTKAYEYYLRDANAKGEIYIKSMEDGINELNSINPETMPTNVVEAKIAEIDKDIADIKTKRAELKNAVQVAKSDKPMDFAKAEKAAALLASPAAQTQPQAQTTEPNKETKDQNTPAGGSAALQTSFTADETAPAAATSSVNGGRKTANYAKEQWQNIDNRVKSIDTSSDKVLGEFEKYLDDLEKQVEKIESYDVPEDWSEEAPGADQFNSELDEMINSSDTYLNETLIPDLTELEKAEAELYSSEEFYDEFDISEDEFGKLYEEYWAPEGETPQPASGPSTPEPTTANKDETE